MGHPGLCIENSQRSTHVVCSGILSLASALALHTMVAKALWCSDLLLVLEQCLSMPSVPEESFEEHRTAFKADKKRRRQKPGSESEPPKHFSVTRLM